MTKNAVKQTHRVCPKCDNVYKEEDIKSLFRQVYEGELSDMNVYCIQCEESELRPARGLISGTVTELTTRDLGRTTQTERARKMFENRSMNRR